MFVKSAPGVPIRREERVRTRVGAGHGGQAEDEAVPAPVANVIKLFTVVSYDFS